MGPHDHRFFSTNETSPAVKPPLACGTVSYQWSPYQLEYLPRSRLILTNDAPNATLKTHSTQGELVNQWEYHRHPMGAPGVMFGHDDEFIYRMTNRCVSVYRMNGSNVQPDLHLDIRLILHRTELNWFSMAVHPTDDLILLTTRPPDVQIQVYRKTSGLLLYTFDMDFPEQFGHLYIRVHAERNLVLVHNRTNALVYVFHLRGDFLFSFSLPDMHIPHTFAIDHLRDLLYVHSKSGTLFTYSF